MEEALRSAAVRTLRLIHRTVAHGPLAHRGLGIVYALNGRLAPRRPVVARVAGSRMLLDLRERYSRGLFYRGTADVEEYSVFCQAIAPGMTVVDVGANIGLFTLAAARLVGPQGRVFAFEPLPRNFRYLVANLALNGYHHAIPEPMAVGNWDGALGLNALAGDNLSVSPTVSGASGPEKLAVPCRRLDSYLKEAGIVRVDVVKIDVEGAEALVVEGMGSLLTGELRPTLVMEVHPDFLESVGQGTNQVLERLRDCSYALWHLQPNGPVAIQDPKMFTISGEAKAGVSRRFRILAAPAASTPQQAYGPPAETASRG